MMTPVYDVGLANWKTNSCSLDHCAARLAFSAFFSNTGSTKEHLYSTPKQLFLCCFHYLVRYTTYSFRSSKSESIKKFLTFTMRLISKNVLFSPGKTSLNDLSSQILSFSFYSFEKTNLKHYNVKNSGTDVLWQQARFKLKAAKARVMHFVATSKSNRRT